MKWVRFGWVPLLLFAFASTLYAQAPTTDKAASSSTKSMAKTPEEKSQEAIAKWKGVLKLTPEQVPQFESVMTDSHKKMADAKSAAAGDKAKMKASMQTILKDRDEALAKILTPEQMKIYREKVAKGASKMKSHAAKTGTSTSK